MYAEIPMAPTDAFVQEGTLKRKAFVKVTKHFMVICFELKN